MNIVPPVRVVLLEDVASTTRAVRMILQRCQLDVVAQTASLPVLLEAAAEQRPDVAVVDLALTGFLGLGVVGELHRAAPGCAVLVLSPFAGLTGAALEAGAHGCATPADVRPLERSLHELGVTCDGRCKWN